MTNRNPILILILAGVAVLAWAGILCAQEEPPALGGHPLSGY